MTSAKGLSIAVAGALGLCTVAAGSARAADGWLAPDAFSGVVTLGGAAGSGQASWLRGGLGKLQAGDRAVLEGSAIVAWQGRLSDRVGAVVSADAQSGVATVVGLDEAYLTLRPTPGGALRLSARAGLFFPPASLEHDGVEWSLARTLTPSAADTWIAEETKVAGLEATLRGNLAGRRVGITAATFQGDDTAGALLTFRGWALHDRRAVLGARFALPGLPALFAGKQAERTRPIDEVDGRWGGYVRVDVAPSPRLALDVFAYDNNGDRTTVTSGQYAWRTRFAQVGARWTPFENGEILVQTMVGETSMGAPMDGMTPANIGFATTYVLASWRFTSGTGSIRLERFSVSDRTFKGLDNNAEQGWAATTAWLRPVSAHAEVVVEGLVARDQRADRVRFARAATQTEAQTRVAFRTSF